MAEVEDVGGKQGKTFVKAVCHKYIDSMEEECDVQVFVPKRGPAKLSESGDLILPRILHLTDCKISQSGDSSEIHRMCVNVSELDLTQNQIHEWSEVLKIIQEIPHLYFLNLTSNPLSGSSVTSELDLTFPGLKQLILNHTHVNWECLVKVLNIFPSVTELHLSLNGYTSVDVPSSFNYPALCKLHFNGNNVVEWEEIKKLGQMFPNLDNLVVTECKLKSLGSSEDIPSTFPKLSVLNINKTHLDSWEEVDKLSLFPALNDVRLAGIPFFESIPQKKRRELIVARTPTISRLNGSHVQELEREDAERNFIRHYLDEEVKPQRYFELEARYGKLDPLVTIDLKPKDIFRVKIIMDDKSEEMDVSTNQTVGEFKKLLSNFVGHPPSKWRLYYHDMQIEQGPELMNFPTRKMHMYNLTDGDHFIVVMKN